MNENKRKKLDEHLRKKLVEHMVRIRHKMCTWPAKCHDPVCHLGWYIFDFFATYDERRDMGNVSKDQHA